MRRTSTPGTLLKRHWRHPRVLALGLLCAVGFPLIAESQTVTELSAAGFVALRSYTGQNVARFAFTGSYRYAAPAIHVRPLASQSQVSAVAVSAASPGKPIVQPLRADKLTVAARGSMPGTHPIVPRKTGALPTPAVVGPRLRADKSGIEAATLDGARAPAATGQPVRSAALAHVATPGRQAVGETIGAPVVAEEPPQTSARTRSKKRIKKTSRRNRRNAGARKPKKASPPAAGTGSGGGWRSRAWSANG